MSSSAVPPRTGRLVVGLVIDDNLDRPDGVQQYVLTLGAELARRGHDVHYIASTTQRTDLPNLHVIGRNVGVTFNGNRLATPLPASRTQVRELLARVPFDVLHVQMPYSPVLAGRIVSAASPRTAVVGTFHIYPHSWWVSAGTRVLGLLERRRLRRFRTVFATSEAAAAFANRTFRVPTTVLGNPVDLARFRPAQAPADPDRPVRVVFLGRLVPRKGPRELVAAALEVTRRGTARPWTLTLAGRGPLHDELVATLAKAGMTNVELPGFVDEQDKPALLADADVIALPSTGGESFGISVVEALASARGVVLAGDNPGYRTTMHGLERQLLDPKDTATFALALGRWIDDAEARDRIAERQREAAARFDTPRIADEVERVYRSAVAGRPAVTAVAAVTPVTAGSADVPPRPARRRSPAR
ncbi:glycosyltransferase family 4 protein [Cellulomonas composti]|uniref:D-inositol 3-phosphate glycosyltransferase n=1 Tax=Cellulomonas composti TaxID=266130 RepID=A0A511JCV1_9CELL|nr:glycosyltransferase family 4 protein [Cellulomonas composti]GEL95609.1 GDP-mannose-dependent alpha-(1-2)-phosphatidylinositol mannosyltransferase [Cellulomonas composti]